MKALQQDHTFKHFLDQPLFKASALPLLVLVCHLPALRAGFIWDDAGITQNPLLQDIRGLKDIWLRPSSIPNEAHYWPLVYSSFWLEYQVWGPHPAAYHAINILLHAMNTILLWRILRRLKPTGAWFIAAIFAVHPIHVESVAWAIERKDVLSGLFFLLSFLFYMKYSTNRKRYLYILSILFFLCAMLSKSITITLPVAILLWLWWGKSKIDKSDILAVLPYFIIALLITLFDLLFFKQRTQAAQGFSLVERFLIAGKSLWFYVWKIIFPINLMPIYPRWQINSTNPQGYIFPLTAFCVPVVLFCLKKKSGKAPAALFLFFLITIAPVLGFIDFGFMRYSFVADRFQYLASIGIIALLVWSVVWFMNEKLALRNRLIPYATGGMVLVLLGVLTWRQTEVYRDYETLFQYAVRKNPRSWTAHNNLATALEKKGAPTRAIEHYKKAMELNPHESQVYYNLAALLSRQKKFQEAISLYQKAIQITPDYPEAHNNLGLLLFQKGLLEKSVFHFRRSIELRPGHHLSHYNLANALVSLGDTKGAIHHFEEAAILHPGWTEAANSLAWILSTSEDPSIRNGDKALKYALIACRNTGYEEASTLDTLAAAYAELGRFEKALKYIKLAEEKGEKDAVKDMKKRRKIYQSARPFRQPLPSAMNNP